MAARERERGNRREREGCSEREKILLAHNTNTSQPRWSEPRTKAKKSTHLGDGDAAAALHAQENRFAAAADVEHVGQREQLRIRLSSDRCKRTETDLEIQGSAGSGAHLAVAGRAVAYGGDGHVDLEPLRQEVLQVLEEQVEHIAGPRPVRADVNADERLRQHDASRSVAMTSEFASEMRYGTCGPKPRRVPWWRRCPVPAAAWTWSFSAPGRRPATG